MVYITADLLDHPQQTEALQLSGGFHSLPCIAPAMTDLPRAVEVCPAFEALVPCNARADVAGLVWTLPAKRGSSLDHRFMEYERP